MIYLLSVLALFEGLALIINQYAIYWSVDGILTHFIAFAALDIVAVYFLYRRSLGAITTIIQIILCISVVMHCFGGYAFVTYNEQGLVLYDASKDHIFNAELLALIFYGTHRGIKRLLRLRPASGLSQLLGIHGSVKHSPTGKAPMASI